VRSLLLSLVPVIMRHLSAYAEIAGADARDAGVLLARRVLVLLLAAGTIVIALVMICVWIMALTWDGPWRAWAAAGLAIVFAAGAAGITIPLLRRRPAPSRALFPRVREEWSRDRDLINRAMRTMSPEASATDGRGATNGGAAEGGRHVAG